MLDILEGQKKVKFLFSLFCNFTPTLTIFETFSKKVRSERSFLTHRFKSISAVVQG